MVPGRCGAPRVTPAAALQLPAAKRRVGATGLPILASDVHPALIQPHPIFTTPADLFRRTVPGSEKCVPASPVLLFL